MRRFLDPAKEEAYLQSVDVEMQKQPMKQFNRLPPSLQKGEGYVYDITTHVVKNKELCAPPPHRTSAGRWPR